MGDTLIVKYLKGNLDTIVVVVNEMRHCLLIDQLLVFGPTDVQKV